MTEKETKISFGIIVLNGEPFTKYCLRSIYDFAYEIIIVEGAAESAKAISTPDGHSTDTTLQSISEFIRNEDTQQKIKLITKNGYWKNKDEMSGAYASKATGDYLWQVDIDEFYRREDIEKIVSVIKNDPSITVMSFKQRSFWGGIDYIEEGPIFGDVYRLFKFGPGYTYIKHRPPTIFDNNGNNLRNINMIDGSTMVKRHGIYMYHYYAIFPLQAKAKADYYSKTFSKDYYKWLNDSYINLKNHFHINDNFWKISWLRKYTGQHPQQIMKMMEDVKSGHINVELRDNHDIDKLLDSHGYRVITFLLRSYFNSLTFIKRYVKKILICIHVIKIV